MQWGVGAFKVTLFKSAWVLGVKVPLLKILFKVIFIKYFVLIRICFKILDKLWIELDHERFIDYMKLSAPEKATILGRSFPSTSSNELHHL